MRKVWLAITFIGVFACTASVFAKEKSVGGTWTLTVEERYGLRLVLEQKNTAVTGTLDWPHGDLVKLAGAFKGGTLTFTGGSGGENFTVHVDSTGTMKADGTMAGTLKARFVDMNEAHEVVRTYTQEIPWTAERGEHGIVHFGR